jgi:hypothetical protein
VAPFYPWFECLSTPSLAPFRGNRFLRFAAAGHPFWGRKDRLDARDSVLPLRWRSVVWTGCMHGTKLHLLQRTTAVVTLFSRGPRAGRSGNVLGGLLLTVGSDHVRPTSARGHSPTPFPRLATARRFYPVLRFSSLNGALVMHLPGCPLTALRGHLLGNGDLNRRSLLAFLTSDAHRCRRVVIGAAIGDRGIVVVR